VSFSEPLSAGRPPWGISTLAVRSASGADPSLQTGASAGVCSWKGNKMSTRLGIGPGRLPRFVALFALLGALTLGARPTVAAAAPSAAHGIPVDGTLTGTLSSFSFTGTGTLSGLGPVSVSFDGYQATLITASGDELDFSNYGEIYTVAGGTGRFARAQGFVSFDVEGPDTVTVHGYLSLSP
jgi:hypothetical protein